MACWAWRSPGPNLLYHPFICVKASTNKNTANIPKWALCSNTYVLEFRETWGLCFQGVGFVFFFNLTLTGIINFYSLRSERRMLFAHTASLRHYWMQFQRKCFYPLVVKQQSDFCLLGGSDWGYFHLQLEKANRVYQSVIGVAEVRRSQNKVVRYLTLSRMHRDLYVIKLNAIIKLFNWTCSVWVSGYNEGCYILGFLPISKKSPQMKNWPMQEITEQ